MYDNLKSLGITNPEEIDRYSLRQEANNDNYSMVIVSLRVPLCMTI